MEKTRMAKYKKYRQKIQKMSEETPMISEVSASQQETKPPVEKKKPSIPSTTTSMTVDQIIEVHDKMVHSETEEERLQKIEAAKLSERWRKVGIIALIVLGICVLIALAAVLAKLF